MSYHTYVQSTKYHFTPLILHYVLLTIVLILGRALPEFAGRHDAGKPATSVKDARPVQWWRPISLKQLQAQYLQHVGAGLLTIVMVARACLCLLKFSRQPVCLSCLPHVSNLQQLGNILVPLPLCLPRQRLAGRILEYLFEPDMSRYRGLGDIPHDLEGREHVRVVAELLKSHLIQLAVLRGEILNCVSQYARRLRNVIHIDVEVR